AKHGEVRAGLDLESPATYRVRRDGRRLALVFAPIAESRAPAPPAPTARAPTFPPRPQIVLDPGHGGHDPGAQGYAVEKDVTLAIAKRVALLLGEKLGAEVVLTRSADATLPLAARTERANAEGADLFVSIHANASPQPRLHGVETSFLTHPTEGRRLAARAYRDAVAEGIYTGIARFLADARRAHTL